MPWVQTLFACVQKSFNSLQGANQRCLLAALVLACVATFPVMSAVAASDELVALRNKIAATKRQLLSLQQKERTTRRGVRAWRIQQQQLRTAIAALETQANMLSREQDSIVTQQRGVQTARVGVSTQFANLGRSAWAAMLLKPDATLPIQQLRSVASAVGQKRAALGTVYDSLSNTNQKLSEAQQQSVWLAQHRLTEQQLAGRVKASQQSLATLQQSKLALGALLQQHQSRLRSIRSMIASQVQSKQRAKKSRARPETSKMPVARGFGKNSLPWPTGSRSIQHGYGLYTNKSSGTVLENPGIDIRAKVGSSVFCVANGTVSTVRKIVGFGTIVIVDHHNSFRSVYANLAGVSVTPGASINAGTVVGTTGANIDGALLHFELWYEKQQLNPTSYLR
jgi:murein hydrolase activator